MTNRREKRLFWILIFACGLVLAAMPVLLPGRYPLLNLAAGGTLIAVAIWRLALLRRRRRREPWHPET